jgi:hypothetical protein
MGYQYGVTEFWFNVIRQIIRCSLETTKNYQTYNPQLTDKFILTGHEDSITDMTYDNDLDMLMTCSLDSTVRGFRCKATFYFTLSIVDIRRPKYSWFILLHYHLRCVCGMWARNHVDPLCMDTKKYIYLFLCEISILFSVFFFF